MKLHIKHPFGYQPEREYIFHVIFSEFLGIEFTTAPHDKQYVEITIDDEEQKLIVTDVLFQTPPENWLCEASLPQLPLAQWQVPEECRSRVASVPVIYGGEPSFRQSEDTTELGLDIFGSAFFMLTRYEEYVKAERDGHDRFPATASLAYQANFLERPIINEYVEILWAILRNRYPNIQRRPRQHRILLSHDVDIPYFTLGLSFRQGVLIAASDLLKRRDPQLALLRTASLLRIGNSRYEKDIFNTFDFIMELSEKRGLASAFYFVAGRSPGIYDVRYDLGHPQIRSLIRHIAQRGHEIGLHTSYNTYLNSKKSQEEFEHLRQVAEAEGIQQSVWGGRQHYLRWSNPKTWQNWEDAGLQYDSTLGFADHIGFRCGVCYEYPVFNLSARRQLNLRERPLIVMEVTFTQQYMNIPWEQANQRINELNQICQRFDGDFTLLWHNSSLTLRGEKDCYNQVLTSLA